MLLLLVDGDLVDEHVVVVLARRRPRSSCRLAGSGCRSSRKFTKKVEDSFSFRYGKTCVFMLAWLIVAESAAHCYAPLAPDL
jgi:hypothetical protein